MITIGNKRRGDTGIMVDRSSSLGNPFKLRDVNDDVARAEVIKQEIPRYV